MIYGDGDIATVLPKRNDLIFFASGVSNSQETRESEYEREEELLRSVDSRARFEGRSTAHVVYFSSLAIFYSDTRYTRHKRAMEAIVKSTFHKYCIVRLGNISWGMNPNTLINHLKAHPEAEIRDEYRYVIDKDEFLHWISLIPDWSVEMNCPGRRMKVAEIKAKYA